ncbi:MAG: helix-turn-helix domain-containing protein [Melioribacteraceae bacterium]|nr:helix-turn-helix domain-containing protein [Melioribacteraceae bacterium]MCF8353816.1 helix-turn-helix domain-containing protein [Melioribacteraceae bacterium]MCF8393652.1 helix-turn-helix domain-containing protein [Melioribacteraceae bacterium]MCF8419462.1 helix-turn-helix domain-containing protein [Melioribacteraceae bacterium]
MSEAYKSISKGLLEAIKHSKGDQKGAREFRPQQIDVKKLRQSIGMTQPKFAASFGISLGTLRHWERGDRNPRGPALVLLNLLSKNPNKVLDILYK